MRRVRYQVACSLDGFIARPDGSTDWIPADPEIDFEALFAQFDVLLMGRRTYERLDLRDPTYRSLYAGKEIVVASRRLRQDEHPGVTIVAHDIGTYVDRLRSTAGKDIWLFGGGELFRTLLERGCVDTVELAVAPVLLGQGVPFLPSPAPACQLRLVDERRYAHSGIVLLTYQVISRGG